MSIRSQDPVPPAPIRSHRLSQDLETLLENKEEEALTLGRLLTLLDERAFAFLILLLSLPSALPVPAPGYSTPFGVLLLLIAFQLVQGRHTPWLPTWALKKTLSPSLTKRMVEWTAPFFRFLESWYLMRPRLSWVTGSMGVQLAALIIALMACLMILPIPLTNTAPAMVIFLVGISLLEKDGLLLLGTLVLGAIAAAFYGFVLSLFIRGGVTAVEQLKDTLKNFIFGP